MISQGWRAAIATAGAVAFCWGVAGAVHPGFDCHGSGRGATYCSLPEGGDPYELAMLVGAVGSAAPLVNRPWGRHHPV
ncbi:hypothetical protein ASC82_18570 [Streptomyces sp. Root431]|uniref:hypothetical protein n=1 Tax=Streptomyces sp. Root431 TaxID=1736535 RepID=UPI0006F433A4|nr:hypothetical protein [Streptomyces sp. Root431]KQX11845.1 hypothetical protein ASC82_18570 [Streptomyces sp. Root431]